MRRGPALLSGLSGTLLIVAGLACWRLGADLPLHRLLHLDSAAWIKPVITLSALGGLAGMGPIALAAFAVLLWRRRTGDALWFFLTIAGGRLMIEGLKLLVKRPRPPAADWLEIVKSWSFPSSHSAGTMMTCIALAVVFGRDARFFGAALLAALLIGWTRIALGVHWPSDVLAGWGFALLWLGICLGCRTIAAFADGRR
jgi:undecaprenyl-diphosphatase